MGGGKERWHYRSAELHGLSRLKHSCCSESKITLKTKSMGGHYARPYLIPNL